MRVALVCPYAWDRFGGVQSHIQALANALRGRGHEATIVAPRSSWPQPASDIVVAEGITYVGRALSIPANGSIAPLAFGPLAARNVRAVLGDLQPDVVHLHEPLIPSLSLLALWGTRAPTVGTFHAAAEASLAYWAAQPMLRRAAQRLTVRTVVSEAARLLIARYFPGSYLTTPNGVEVGRFATAQPEDLGVGSNVLFFGRIERRKGLEVLIQAMTRLRDLETRLVVAGGGPEEHHCRSLAERLGVEAIWLGSPHDDVKPRIFQAAEVYCAPNLGGESFGIVLVEAMAAGAPVVCSDLPGFRAVVGDAGLLAAPGDAGALADALRLVLTDQTRAKEMGAAGLHVAGAFDWEHHSANVERVYERAVATGGPPR